MKVASSRYESKEESLTLSTQLMLFSRAASGHAKPTSLLAQLIFVKCSRAVFFAFEPPRSSTRVFLRIFGLLILAAQSVLQGMQDPTFPD